MRSAPTQSFGRRAEEPEPAPPAPFTLPAVQVPIVLVLDKASLQVMATDIAMAIAQAVYDGVAAGIDPNGDSIPTDSGPASRQPALDGLDDVAPAQASQL